MSQQRRYDVAAMLWRCCDVVTTFLRRCEFAGNVPPAKIQISLCIHAVGSKFSLCAFLDRQGYKVCSCGQRNMRTFAISRLLLGQHWRHKWMNHWNTHSCNRNDSFTSKRSMSISRSLIWVSAGRKCPIVRFPTWRLKSLPKLYASQIVF